MNCLRWSCIVIVTLLGSCASTSPHYYTLLHESERTAPAAMAAPFRLEVRRIPAQVDRLELVIRLADGGISIADGERWIAPVADELQNALSAELSRRLGAARPAEPTGPNSMAVRLNVERFESSPSQYALIEASWNLELKAAAKHLLIHCRTWAYEQVSGSYPELVRGYQRAVAAIADEIATVALDYMGGLPDSCPTDRSPQCAECKSMQ
jgi:uncharacterized lipoprotein YmbA